MPKWTDEGLILSIRPHGERNAVASLLTKENGRHSGLVYAYDAASKRGTVQIGNLVQAKWRARLSEQLGTYQLELVRNPSAVFLDDALKLAGLSSCCAILDVSTLVLPEPAPATISNGPEIYKTASKEGVYILSEAAVCGGIPIIEPLKRS